MLDREAITVLKNYANATRVLVPAVEALEHVEGLEARLSRLTNEIGKKEQEKNRLLETFDKLQKTTQDQIDEMRNDLARRKQVYQEEVALQDQATEKARVDGMRERQEIMEQLVEFRAEKQVERGRLNDEINILRAERDRFIEGLKILREGLPVLNGDN